MLFQWKVNIIDTILALLCSSFNEKYTSRPEVFCKNGVHESIAKFTGKQLCQSLSFNKVADVACNFIKRDSGTGVFL